MLNCHFHRAPSRLYLRLTIVMLLSCFGAPAQGPRERPRYVVQALDLDKDGALSAQEIASAPGSLRALDRNGDGELTPDELEPPRSDAGASADQLTAQLMAFDRNGDGVLTPEELPQRMQAMFARADGNKDGKLTPTEIREMAAHAGSPNGHRLTAGQATGMMRRDPVLNALDADHDGVISASEIQTASTNLAALDVNHDGHVAADEMRVKEQTPAERVTHVLGEFDTNKDGKLSRDEVPDGMRARFAESDRNGDGFLDSGELLAMFSAMQSQAAAEHAPPQNAVSPEPAKGQH